LAVLLALMPQFAKAGPCTNDIAALEATIQLPGVEALGSPGQRSIND
jgi:hypothetical protein